MESSTVTTVTYAPTVPRVPPPTFRSNKENGTTTIIILSVIFGNFALWGIIIPLIRSKNLCCLGSLCNLSPTCRDCCVECGCDDYCTKQKQDNCIDECENGTEANPRSSNDCCTAICFNIIIKIVTFSSIAICFVINIFSCKYESSYYISRYGESYLHNVENDPQYHKSRAILKKHDDMKSNIMRHNALPPPMENIVNQQPNAIIEIND